MSSFEGRERRLIWNRAREIFGQDPAKVRRDDHEHKISWADFGDARSETGWTIDLIVPLELGGRDTFANRRPVSWRTKALADEVNAELLLQQGPRQETSRRAVR